MADRHMRESALAGAFEGAALKSATSAPVTVSDHAGLTMIALRGHDNDPAFRNVVAGQLNLPLPAPGQASGNGSAAMLWLGPDHFLYVLQDGDPATVVTTLEEAFASAHATAIDVSSARACLRLSGEHARDLLDTGCKLDLDPRVFGPDGCVQTILGNTTAIIHHVPGSRAASDAPTYDLYVARSLALSFYRWLQHAGREFGLVSVREQI